MIPIYLLFGYQSFTKISPFFKTGTQIQVVRQILFLPPTSHVAESTFSWQKWLIGKRRAGMTPSNCNIRVVGRSLLAFKRRMSEARQDRRKRQKLSL